VPHLPPAFDGKTIAVLTDFHHGPWVHLNFINDVVKLANTLGADAFALVGDFAHKGRMSDGQLPPCMEALQELRAPWGAFAVPGNHDMLNEGRIYREAIATTSLTDLTNRSFEVKLNGQSLWFAGVDDLWWGKPNLHAALDGIPKEAAVILLAHNPDYAEQEPSERVGLMLSGHTHGGQVYLPVIGSPWLPSRYGAKYRQGLVQGPKSQVFISRGLGEAGVPLRLNCPPEINLLTLTTKPVAAS
jgi:predicted MPP superfamily phosphohydrolase